MPSKRDQLKKLKQGRKKESIQEMSSPVDDTLKKLDETGDYAEEQRVNIAEMQEKTVVEDIKTTDSVKPQETIEQEREKESGEAAAEHTAELIQPEITSEKAQDQGSEDQGSEDRENESPETVEEEQPQAIKQESLKSVPKVSVSEQKKESTKRTSMALLVENNKFIRLRSIQLGLSIQDYVNLLVDEEIAREKSGQTAGLGDIENNLDMNYRRGQNSTIIALVLKESNARFLKRGGAMHGMNATAFLNHIISEERKREEKEGPRQGEYDEF